MNLYGDYDEKQDMSDDSILPDSRLIELESSSLQDPRLLMDSEGHQLDAEEARMVLERGGLLELPRSLQDPRLLDAAETLVNLRGPDLGPSNNPLFGAVTSAAASLPGSSTTLTVLQNSDPFARDEKTSYQLLTEMPAIPPNLIQLDSSNSGLLDDHSSISVSGGGSLSHPVILTSVSPGVIVAPSLQTPQSHHSMEGVRTTPAPTRGRGRGRGGGGASAGGGPSKRGRGKKDTTGGGGRGAVGAMGGGLVGGAGGMDGMGGGGSTMTDGCEDEGAETGGEQAAAEKPAEMLRVGSLFIKSSIFDDVLTERKLELFNNPSVIEFLKKNRICS